MIVSPKNKKVPSLFVNENSIIKTQIDGGNQEMHILSIPLNTKSMGK